MPITRINLEGWQDYRGDHAGVLLFVETSKQAALPVRDQLNECGKGFLTEPNYETATYNLVGGFNTRNINSIVKNNHRYILFGTRYQGINEEFKDRYFIHGYMRIDKIKDARSIHMNRFMRGETTEPECINQKHAWACWSDEIRFYRLEDCFELTEKVMKNWGYKGRITRQMKLLLENEKLDEIIEWFSSKNNIVEEYIQTAIEFKDSLDDDNEEEDGDDW